MARTLLQVYARDKTEAFAFYKEAFDATIGGRDYDENGVLIHQELDVCGLQIAVGDMVKRMTDAGDKPVTGNTMQFCLQFDKGQEERVRKACDMLAEGGEVLTPFGKLIWTTCGAELIDKYGVWWCLFV